MNDNARKLVAALRSGEYKQTNGYLRDNNGYCCLGVACDIFHKETGQGGWVGDADTFSQSFDFEVGEEVVTTLLPKAVEEWLGFADETGEYTVIEGEDEFPNTLIDLNDGGKDFNYIADLIESEPKGLFK